MKTEREKRIEEIYGKSIWSMTPKEIAENNLVSDYVQIVDENADWDKDGEITECRIKWLDDQCEEDVLIYEFNDELENDDDIFFYGMSRAACIGAMISKEACQGEWQIVEVY